MSATFGSPARWIPRSEEDLRSAIGQGWLEETHYLEMKREVGPAKANRKEHARDLAGFAPDGGHILVGVGEDKENKTWHLEPQDLTGLGERIEQIARQGIDPPLYVRAHDIPSEADSHRGYVLIEIPPSTEAPHMVDGIYYGRGEKTKMRLSDAEVLRHHRARQDQLNLIDRRLDEEIADDPVITRQYAANGHLYLVAEPLLGRRGMVSNLIYGSKMDVTQLLHTAEDDLPNDLKIMAPTLSQAHELVRRSRGIAWCSGHLREKRKTALSDAYTERKLVDIEFGADGGVRVFVGGLTAHEGSMPQQTWIMDGVAMAYTLRLLGWLRAIADASDYRGPWGLGVAGNGLEGHRGYTHVGKRVDVVAHYDRDEYREITSASLTELREHPEGVLDRLLGPLLRALATYDLWTDELSHQEGTAAP